MFSQSVGEYTDAESGLVYLRARYYDPATQQFLTVDPIVAWTEQAYNYVGGSPLNATDPSGLCCGTDGGVSWGGGGRASGGGGGGSYTQPSWLDEFAHVWRGLFEPGYGRTSGPRPYAYGGGGGGGNRGSGNTGSSCPIWNSNDPNVANLANSIEAKYPGHVVGVNIKRAGYEIDIETKNAIIEVKSGTGNGLTRQIRDRLVGPVNPTGKPVIGYSPNMGPHAARSINNAGGIAAGGWASDLKTLLELLRP